MNDTTDSLPNPLPEVFLDMMGSHFLEAARYLREILDEAPEQLKPAAKAMKIGVRKAYALAQIDRAFHELGIDHERLRQIGWTKLAMLAPYVDADNVEKLLGLASNMPSHALKLTLRGEIVHPDDRVIALYLRPDELVVFDKVMETFGGIRHPNGWVNKEAAVIAALSKALEG